MCERCLDIAERIIENAQSHGSTTAGKSTSEHAVRRTDAEQHSNLTASLRDSIHNAREAAGEARVVLQRVREVAPHNDQQRTQFEQQLHEAERRIKHALAASKTLEERERQHVIDVERSGKAKKRNYESPQKQIRDVSPQKQQQQQQQYDAGGFDSYQHAEFALVNDDDTEQQQQQATDSELQAELYERQQFVLEIERDVMTVHEMFRDLNQLVAMQQYVVDSIEESIAETATKTRDGMKELYKAEQWQRKNRRKMCFMVLAMALIILTVICTVAIIIDV